MTDIVERLTRTARLRAPRFDPHAGDSHLLLDAVDEIERLRRTLTLLRRVSPTIARLVDEAEGATPAELSGKDKEP